MAEASRGGDSAEKPSPDVPLRLGRPAPTVEEGQSSPRSLGLSSREARKAIGRDTRPSADDDDEELPDCSNFCIACTVGVVAILIGLVVYLNSGPVDPLDAHVKQFRNDEVLRAVVWPGQTGGSGGVQGPNGRSTDWAIFFYRCAVTPTREIFSPLFSRSSHSASAVLSRQAVLRRVQARMARLSSSGRDYQLVGP